MRQRQTGQADKLGIYIHIPFCRIKCDYCDFYSLAGRDPFGRILRMEAGGASSSLLRPRSAPRSGPQKKEGQNSKACLTQNVKRAILQM